MTEPTRPAAAKAYGRTNWIWVPTIASATLAPTVAEINSASGLDVTNMVFASSAPKPTQNTNLVEQIRRLGDTTVAQFVGTTTYGGGTVTMQFNQQGAAASEGVLAWEKFLNSSGTVTGFFCRRTNVPKATTPAAGMFVDTYPAEVGPSLPDVEGDGENSEGSLMFTWAVYATPAFKVAILA